MYSDQIRNLYKTNLNLNVKDRLLLFTDDEKDYLQELIEDFAKVGREFTQNIKFTIYSSTKTHGAEPPEELWEITFGKEAISELKEKGLLEKVLMKENYSQEEVSQILKEKAQDVPTAVVAFPYFSTTHTFYRKALTEVFGARYVSMPLFDPTMFLTSMNVDWGFVAKLSTDIADMLTEAEWVHVKSEYGTDLEFSVKGRKGIADTGLFHNPGEFGNLPAGEAFTAPIETEAYGRLVILYAPDRELERPITMKFIDGGVESIEGFEDYRYFIEDIFKKMPEARFIAEFGVGTNPKASRPDNLLEAEKILGTVHVAIGDNHTFGGLNKVGFHTDYVVFKPTVLIGGKGWEKKLLLKGELQKI
ncbi:leucyl aminopeptidase (aminopeptidase T) [Hydrogenivirga caldilitoris]|uniref:Leucyl aminopeptidase (Aminopeptidase T) n=1 Tax=Hydrogenivirga caldilitoris TaxID=246264 RepID=A0A497XRP4_9AQUI|nr:aminopeptidase [Hydrogenivirga caldilitoris]RLJ70759.1 leucyl aminopeptidase (aminopeptidase T) [Hydrogenivirga caldilitoris]